MNLDFKAMIRNLLILVPIFFIGCNFFDQDVYVDIPEHEPRIVLNSVITPTDTLVRVLLTKSVGMESAENVGSPLKGATVQFTSNGQEVGDVKYADSTGHYLIPYVPVIGDQVKIEVLAAGLPTVSSSVIVPRSVILTNGKLDGTRRDMDGWEYKAVKFTIEDIMDETNFYEVSLIVENTHITDDSIYTYQYPIDWLESPISWLTYTYRGLAFTDAAFKNTSLELEVWFDDYNYYNDGDVKLYVVVRTTTESYYEYMTTYDIHSWNQYPDLFSGEPVPMYTNIENGFGIFGAYTESLIEVQTE